MKGFDITMVSQHNPFGRSQSLDAKVFEIMSDCQWHSKCEIESTGTGDPNRNLQNIKDRGWPKGQGMLGPEKQWCERCGKQESHWRLTSEAPVSAARTRGLRSAQIQSVKAYFKYVDAFDGLVYPDDELEVDHKIPTKRMNGPELVDESRDDWMHDYQLLTRQHNLEKRQACNDCNKTGLRPIGKYVEGERRWQLHIGCSGCFYHDGRRWREFFSANPALEACTRCGTALRQGSKLPKIFCQYCGARLLE